MSIKVNYAKAIKKLLKTESFIKQSGRDVVDIIGKGAALELARVAAPFGTGDSAKKAGEGAVARDIEKVYAFPGKAWKDINQSFAKKVFWKAFKAGEYEVAEKTLDDFGSNLSGLHFEKFDGGAKHRAIRDSRGKVRLTKPLMIVTKEKALLKYIKQEQDKVGTAKGGFADIVRAIGGTIRGLREKGGITANWIVRNAKGYGAAFRGGPDDNPHLRIQNRVPYASGTVNGGQIARAKAIARQNALEYLKHIVQAKTRELNQS